MQLLTIIGHYSGSGTIDVTKQSTTGNTGGKNGDTGYKRIRNSILLSFN